MIITTYYNNIYFSAKHSDIFKFIDFKAFRVYKITYQHNNEIQTT